MVIRSTSGRKIAKYLTVTDVFVKNKKSNTSKEVLAGNQYITLTLHTEELVQRAEVRLGLQLIRTWQASEIIPTPACGCGGICGGHIAVATEVFVRRGHVNCGY